MNSADVRAEVGRFLGVMKASAIPNGSAGLWSVYKLKTDKPLLGTRSGRKVCVPPGVYTFLQYLTEATMLCVPAGETVMEDTDFELRTHLAFVRQAFGRVLITGLGLGCVARGLLANPRVEHVTCIEQSSNVLRLVAPYMPTERLTIVRAEAVEWCRQNQTRFDCAWHDLWTDREKGEPHLDLRHMELIRACQPFAERQGAWAMDRRIKAIMLERGFPWLG